MQALLLSAEEKIATLQAIPVPYPGPDELQVKVSAVALNPVDALYTANPLGKTGRTVGSDFAGIVSARGTNVHHVQVNTRVAGFLQGACSINERPGAFAEYLIVPCDLVWFVPDGISLIEAATISLCSLTAAQALYGRLGLLAPFPVDTGDLLPASEPNKKVQARGGMEKPSLKIVVYGASTSVALYAAQLIQRSSKASGVPIVLYGVASHKHHMTLSEPPYSYTALVDYSDKDWPTQISEISGGKVIDLALDCISEGDSVTHVASTLSESGKIAVVRSREGGAWKYEPTAFPSEPLYGAVWEGLGERVEYQGLTIPASPQERKFTAEFYKYVSESPLLPNPVRLMPGGLERIQEDGFALLGPGTMGQRATEREEDWMKPVRGEKLVYEVKTGP